MRLRHMAVVGAVLVAAWSGSAGIAQAGEGDVDPATCETMLSVASVDDQSESYDPCDEIPVDEDCFFIPFPTDSGEDAAVEGEDTTVETDGDCSIDVTVGVDGDCENPESFTFTVNATGLEAKTEYTIYLTSADPDQAESDDVPPYTSFAFTTGADGSVKDAKQTVTEGAFDFPAGAFTLTYIVVNADELPVYLDQVQVGECTPDTSGGTTPTTSPTTPAPTTTPAPAPSTTVAPVVVTHPAAAQPAVLANTGTPVTAAALLGGGLLVAGAGALVATRRRSS